MRPIEEPLALVVDVAQLHTGTVRPRRGGRTHRQEPPENSPPLADRDPDLAGRALGRRGLPGIRLSANRVVGLRRRRGAIAEAQHRTTGHVHAHYFVPARSAGGQQPDSEHPLEATPRLVVEDQRRHGLVGLEPPLPQGRTELSIALEDADRARKLLRAWDWVDSRLGDV
jgi:hypothetical protein